MSPRTWLFSLVAAAVPACGSPAGTHPHDMSASQHEQAAAQTDEAATAHARRYDPGARADLRRCAANGSPTRGSTTVCWTSVENPTDEHRREAEAYRALAAQHRQASAELRAAEKTACAGIAAADRDMSPFLHREDIRFVEPLMDQGHYASIDARRTGALIMSGAKVTFRAVPGLTAEWLQRVVDCHVARNATLGNQAAGMPDCPLVPRGVTAKVVSTRAGFEVDIRAGDRATAEDVLARAKRLLPAHAGR